MYLIYRSDILVSEIYHMIDRIFDPGKCQSLNAFELQFNLSNIMIRLDTLLQIITLGHF